MLVFKFIYSSIGYMGMLMWSRGCLGKLMILKELYRSQTPV